MTAIAKIFSIAPPRLSIAIGLLSVSLIAYQVAIIQLLSYLQWYHFANMIISVALLGFGAAGTALSLFRKKMIERGDALVPLLMVGSGLCMMLAVWLSQTRMARYDSYLLFVERSQWLALLINYLLFFLPFFFGALSLGILFVKYVQGIGRLYFFNLLGSGIGALLVAGLSMYFFPSVLPVVPALLAIISGLLANKTRSPVTSLLALGGIALAAYWMIKPIGLKLSQYKSLSRTMNLPAARIDYTKPGPYGLVEVVSAEAMRYAPGLSLAFTGEVPVKKVVFNNGDWFGTIASRNKDDSVHHLDYATLALPYQLAQPKNVLVLHAGTGLMVSHALSHQALLVDAVEPHLAVNQLLTGRLAAEADSLYAHPAVNLHGMEPRSFLATTNTKYDLIQLPMVGSFGGNAGLYAMREEYTLTREAFLEMWNRLEPGGMISLTAWMDYPFRNPLKSAATIFETAGAAGVSPARHIIAIRSWAAITFLLKKTPFSSNEIAVTRKFCDSRYFDPAILPGLTRQEQTVYNVLNDTTFFDYISQLADPSRKQLYREYDFHIRPATDDKPYFSQFLRFKSLNHLNRIFGTEMVPFLELGWLIAVVTFFQLTVLALVLILLPLLKLGWKSRYKLPTFLYFSGLGVGYMLLEIVLIQRFVLFFGNPVYATAFVIGAMLIASGAGSYYSSGWQTRKPLIQKILLLVISFLLVYAFALTPFLQAIMSLPLVAKLVVSLVIIAIPSFLMGMPFPAGLNILSSIEEKNIPWAWGINGCMSVISAAMATLLAVEAGFRLVMFAASIAYAICLFAIYLFRLK